MMLVSPTAAGVAPLELVNLSGAARRLARLGRQALSAEAELTPKPGLVDRRGNGAHTDLSLELMHRSAAAIEPYFLRMAAESRGCEPGRALREQLALIGRRAERAMLEATAGSNAHKGAIWTLGLLIGATALRGNQNVSPASLAATAQTIAGFEDKGAPRLVSHGDEVAKRYGVAGARGEALDGFPHVIQIALPLLQRRRREGATEQVARLDALLGIMARLDDTCLLYRGGQAALTAAKTGAAAVEAAGGSGSLRGLERLQLLERRLLKLNASPGGSADLLAATLFLDAVENHREEIANGNA